MICLSPRIPDCHHEPLGNVDSIDTDQNLISRQLQQPLPLPMTPPANFGTIETGHMYRSSFPNELNLSFLESLGIRAILCLVETPPSEAYTRWVNRCGIERMQVSLLPNKKGKVSTTVESLRQALTFIHRASVAGLPILIHCNQGRHRTGCVVSCYRKMQGGKMEEILEEYTSFASPKQRPGDISLIHQFDPSLMAGAGTTILVQETC